ncbi:MAG: YvcK family protein [Candidatus Dojkabacteria bacterium]
MAKNIVVIGGGTGTFVVLSALKKEREINPKAIISVTDSGGSTGRLRDQFGTLPVGDLRQCLVALADDHEELSMLRKLFVHRFDKGDLKGHNFGNIFLTALTEIAGNEEEAIKYTSKILRVRGEVIPVTTADIDLVAEYEDGSVLVGEASIDEPNHKHDSNKRITKLRIQPAVNALPGAVKAISKADIIIVGPGDLYTSILAPICVKGIAEAIKESNATFIYITNLMTKRGQTTNMSLQQQLDELTKYCLRTPDYVFVNNSELPAATLAKYELEEAFPVKDDLGENAKIIRGNFVDDMVVDQASHDTVTRSLIRHDGDKIVEQLKRLSLY